MRTLAALVLGESTWPPAGLVRDPARVERVVPVVVVFSAFSTFSVAALGATFLVRFLGTGNSEFSLSSPDSSSLLRFFARAVFVALAYVGTALVLIVLFVEVDLMRTSGEDAGREEGALGTALRGLRPAVPVPTVFLVAAVVVVVVVMAVVSVTLVGGAGAVISRTGADALRRLASVVWRVTTGMRLTRRSRRDCILAH